MAEEIDEPPNLVRKNDRPHITVPRLKLNFLPSASGFSANKTLTQTSEPRNPVRQSERPHIAVPRIKLDFPPTASSSSANKTVTQRKCPAIEPMNIAEVAAKAALRVPLPESSKPTSAVRMSRGESHVRKTLFKPRPSTDLRKSLTYKTYNKRKTPSSSARKDLSRIAEADDDYKENRDVFQNPSPLSDQEFAELEKQFQSPNVQQTNVRLLEAYVKLKKEHHEKEMDLLTTILENARKSLVPQPKTEGVLKPRQSPKINLIPPTPSTSGAASLYNSFRKDCPVLCTPVFARTSSPVAHGSFKQSLSRKIQKQCLLLQDTPKVFK